MTLHIVNPGDKDWTRGRWVIRIGAYGETNLLVWANSLDTALDEAIDWLVDHEPGYLADEQAAEAYREALAEGMSEDQAMDEAHTDLTCGGNCGNYIRSDEWHYIEEPDRATLIRLRDE